MKKIVTICAAVLIISTCLQAAVVQETYTFTGADLLNNVFDSTARYSTDGSLKVYEGMRSLFPGTEFTYTGSGATYLGGSWTTNFNSLWAAAVADERVLSTFWLSGDNGYSGQWGEDYKPFGWVSGTGPSGWTFSTQTNSDPTEGFYTDQIPVWTTTTAGLQLTAADLASKVFTVTIKFDTEDMWWGNPKNYLYGCNTAPNSLDGLTMFFGSYFSKDGADVNLYEGNMFAVPEPVTMVILALGGLFCSRKK